MSNPETGPGFDGSPEDPARREGYVPFDSLLPEDFAERLKRLREVSGLTWSGMARALGVSHKQIYRWRDGVEPCGGAMHSLYLFADQLPGGLDILMGKDFQMPLLGEVDDEEGKGDEEQGEEEDGS